MNTKLNQLLSDKKKRYDLQAINLSISYLTKLMDADKELNNGIIGDKHKHISQLIELFDKQNIKQNILNTILVQELCNSVFANNGELSTKNQHMLQSLLDFGLIVDKCTTIIVALHCAAYKTRDFPQQIQWLKWVEQQSPQSIFCTSLDVQNNPISSNFNIYFQKNHQPFTILDLLLLCRTTNNRPYNKLINPQNNNAHDVNALNYLVSKNCNALLSAKVVYTIANNNVCESPFWNYLLYQTCDKTILNFLFSKVNQNSLSQDLKNENIFKSFLTHKFYNSKWTTEYLNNNPSIKNERNPTFSQVEDFFENKDFEINSKFGTLRWIIENHPQFVKQNQKDFLSKNDCLFLIEQFNESFHEQTPIAILHLIKLLRDSGAKLNFFAFHPRVPQQFKPYFEQTLLENSISNDTKYSNNKIRL